MARDGIFSFSLKAREIAMLKKILFNGKWSGDF
jgi:hypothetical protein